MKKRTGLALAGGILEIIAGINLLMYALWYLYVCSVIPNGLSLYNWDMLIIFCCLIFFGIMAIIGKPKKDLITYGIMNLVGIAYMIYSAVGNSKNEYAIIIAIILVFSFEILLLIISSMFFFFTKKSEYDIVFENRLKTRKDNQPQEYKKLKKTYILISLALVLAICLSQLLNMIGVIILVLSVVGFIVLTAIVSKKNKSDYSLKTNIVFCCVAVFIMFGCVTYNNLSYQQTTLTSISSPIINTVHNTYLWYDTSENDYLVLKGIYSGNESGDLIYISDNKQFDELAENAMEIVAECRYVNPTTNKNEIAYYEFFENTSGSLKYYCETNGEILNALPEYKNVTKEAETNKTIILMIDLVGLLVAVILILGTYNAQLEFDVKKQLKAEEKGQVINKYNNNISQAFQPQPQQNMQPDTNIGQAPQTRVLPPLPKEIKERMEQNRSNH